MTTPGRGGARGPSPGGRGRGFGGMPYGNQTASQGPVASSSAQQSSASQSARNFGMFCGSDIAQGLTSPDVANPFTKRKQADDVEAARKRLSYDYNNLISVLVGPNEIAFTVHENYICAKSRFFKAACRKEWSEGITRIIRLPEAEPEMFRSYLVWVYTDGLAVDITNSEPVQAQETKYSTFVKLYVLGDRLEDLRLRNSIMEILVNSNHQFNHESVTWAFEHTPIGSLLRKMLVSFAATRWVRAIFDEHKAKYHPEFVLDLAAFLMHQTDKQKTGLAEFIQKLPEFLEDEPKA